MATAPTPDPADPTEVRLAYQLAWSDHAAVLIYRFTRPAVWFGVVALAALSGYSILQGVSGPIDHWLAFGLPSVLLAVLAGQVLTAHSQFKSLPAEQRAVELVFTSGEVRSRTPVSESVLTWDAFAAWSERHEVFLLCLKPVVWRPVPKRGAASDGDVDRLRELLAAKLPRL